MIPKLIHQIWIQGEEHLKKNYPKKFQQTQSFQKYMPDYQHKIWSENEIIELIKNKNSHLLNIYLDCPNYAAKSDIGRFIILFTYGGLYADIDYEVFTDIGFLYERQGIQSMVVRSDSFKKFDLFLTKFRYNTALMAFTNDHPLVKTLIDNIINLGSYKNLKNNSYEKNNYNYFTGPTSLSDLIEKDYENIDKTMLIVSNEVLEPVNMSNQNKSCETTEDCKELFPSAMGIHHTDGSWIPNADFLKQIGSLYGNLNDYWPILVGILLVLFLAFFISTIVLAAKK